MDPPGKSGFNILEVTLSSISRFFFVLLYLINSDFLTAPWITDWVLV